MAANSKNFLPPYPVVSGASMATNIISSVTDVRFLDNIIYQLSWTGTPVGTFSIQKSLDYAASIGGTVTNSGTWTDLPLSSLTNPNGSSGNTDIFINQYPGPYLRLVYTEGSGTGSLTAYVSGKAV